MTDAGRKVKMDPKDRRMLQIALGLVVALFILLAFFTPGDDPNANPLPGSFLTGQHGAKAAFTLLEQSGYAVERWDNPLSELSEQADSGTVLILAEPSTSSQSDNAAIATILNKGGRVLATGYRGALLLPGNEVTNALNPVFAACEAKPDGLNSLNQAQPNSGSIWVIPSYTWSERRPDIRTIYTCAGKPVVVAYPVGKGTVIWWASATPLENGSIARDRDLDLLLDSVGPQSRAQGQKIYWDESLHSAPPGQFAFVYGPVWKLFLYGSMGLAALVIFSFSRRSGPLRALPHAPRTTPIEFLDALGALYRSAGASSTAMQIAWERFRAQAALLTGQRTAQLGALELAAVIERRFGAVAKAMEADLVAAEEACWNESLKPRRALALTRSLRRHEETLREASKRGMLFITKQVM
jgi:hypothetical protein